MNPNQIFARPVVEPWKPVTLPDILGDLFGGAAIAAVNAAVPDDPFVRGWNAAMRHMKNNPPASAPLPLPTNVIFNDPATIGP